MNNEEKILEMLSAMQETMTAMQDRQDRTEQILAGMQSEMKDMRTEMTDMQSEMKDMRTEMTDIHKKLDDLTEAHEETRDGVNRLLEWSERASSVLELPLPQII